MKHLYTLIIAFTFLTISNLSIAQQNVVTTNVTVNGNCDGTAYNSAFNNFGPPMHNWSWYRDTLLIPDTDSLITGLCMGNYSLVLDSMGVVMFTETFEIGDYCFGFSGTMSFTDCTPNACDGNIQYTPTGGTAPYTFLWNNGSTTQYQTDLCAGWYLVECYDMNGCQIADAITLGPQLVNANLSFIDDYNTNCTGWASIDPSGGVPPYSVYWSNGGDNYLNDSLCAGIYSVVVWDSNMDSTTVDFVIADSNSYFPNNPFPNNPVNDTLYSDLVTNCEIDYTDIDSASLYLAVYDSINANLYVTWAIYSPNDTIYINDTLGLAGNAGYYSLVISVYCPTKSINDFLKIEDVIYFNGSNVSMLSLEDSDILNDLQIFPNPFNESITFDNSSGLIHSAKIVDLNGRLVLERNALQSSETTISGLEFMNSGSYFLILNSTDNSKVFKIVKF